MTAGLLLSGGMDSIAIAWWKRPAFAITIDYGQRAAAAERLAATQVCSELGIQHSIITIDCRSLGSGDMSYAPPHAEAKTSDWWPYRNQMLITLASMRAIALGVRTLYIGTVRSDGESHLDGTEDFVRKVDELTSYQEGGMRIVAPAIGLSTAELVREARVPPSLLAWSHSCHKADIACGDCRGCNKYLDTYRELGPEYSIVD
nr:7-cyano-7-deazaguanine synthase [Derxia gummosa]